jgi:hypothetical protein
MSTTDRPAPALPPAADTGAREVTHPIPDVSAALQAWKHAYQARNAYGFFKRRLEDLMNHVRELLVAAPTGGGPLTFVALGRIPQPAQDFYSELIDASESLAELIEDHDPMRTAYRHPYG